MTRVQICKDLFSHHQVAQLQNDFFRLLNRYWANQSCFITFSGFFFRVAFSIPPNGVACSRSNSFGLGHVQTSKLSLHLLPPPSHSLHAINGFTFDYFLLKRIHPFCLKKNGCWCCICTADFSLVSCNPAIFATNYWSCKQGLIWLSSSRYLESPFLKNWSRLNNFRSIIGTNNATFTFNWKIASLGT